MSRLNMRWLIAGVAIMAVVAILTTALVAVPGLHAAPANQTDRPQNYLALGDSVAFGFSPLVDPRNPDNFIGYPNTVAAAVKEDLTNASCSGEASGGFISLTGTDNVCRNWRFVHGDPSQGLFLPLHVAYTTSQLDFAVQFLEANPHTLLVSLNIGANDLFVLENRICGGGTTPAEILCIEHGLPVMLATLSANLDIIYGAIRNTAGYHHKLVGLTYYSLNYSDPVGTGIISEINQVVAARTLAWGGSVADGFGEFQTATAGFGGDSCAAGLLILLANGTCNIHPSPKGRDLLAQAIVNVVRAD